MAESIGGLFVKFGANTVEFDKGVKGINGALSTLKKDVATFNKKLKFDPGNAELLAKKLENFQEQARIGGIKLEELRRKQKALGDEKIGTAEWQKLETEIQKTSAEMEVVERSIGATEKAIKDLDPKSIAGIERALEDVASELDIVNRKLELDPDNLDLIERQATLMGKQMELSGNKVEKLGAELKELKASDAPANDIKKMERALEEAEIEAMQLERALNDVEDEAEDAGKAGRSIKDSFVFGAAAGAGAKALDTVIDKTSELSREAIASIDSLKKFESTMAFAGFSPEKIKEAKKEVKKYADDTVYEMETISNTTAQLGANGVKDFTGLTQAAGNLNAVAGGNAETFKGVAMALTQTVGAGKLTTENWNQIADAIPGASGKLQEAMKKNGAFTGEFRKAMEKGEITADEFQKAIMDLGMQDVAVEAAKSTETFEGAIGNLEATIVSGIQNIVETIGTSNITGMINSFTTLAEAAFDTVIVLMKVVKVITPMAVTIGITSAAIVLLNANLRASAINAILTSTTFTTMKASMIKAGVAAKGLAASMKAIFMANPILAIIGILIGLLITLYIHSETVRNAVDKVAAIIKKGLVFALNICAGWLSVVGTYMMKLADICIQFSKGVLADLLVVLTNTAGKMSEFGNAISNRVMPAVKTSIGYLQSFYNILAAFAGGVINGIISGFRFMADAIAKIGKFMAPVGAMLESMGGKFGKLGGVLGIAASLLTKLAMAALGITGPFGLIIGLLVSFVSAWVKTGDMSANGITKVFDDLSSKIENISTFLSEALPGIIESGTKMIVGFIEGMTAAIPGIVESISGIIETLTNTIVTILPMLIETGTMLITSILEGIITALPAIINAAISLITGFVNAIVTMIPLLIGAAVLLINGLLEGIIKVLPKIIEAGINLVTKLLDAIVKMLPKLIKLGIDLVKKLLEGLVKALPKLIEASIGIITGILGALILALPLLIKAGIDIIMALLEGIIGMLPAIIEGIIQIITALIGALIEALPLIIDAGIQLLMALIEGIIQILPQLIEAVIMIIMELINALIEALPQIIDAGIQLLTALIDGLIKVIPQLIEATLRIIMALIDALIKNIPKIIDAGIKLLKALIDGIKKKKDELFTAAKDLIKDVISKIGEKAKEFAIKGALFITKIISGFHEKAKELGDKAKDLGKKIIDSVVDGAKNIRDKGIEIAKNLIDGLLDKLGNIKKLVKDKIKGAMSGLGDWFKGIVGKDFSPNGFDFGGAVSGMFKIKNLNDLIPVFDGNGSGGNTTYNINVTANSSQGSDIAREIERIIVRRVNK
ncbi:tape measure protein [Listeria monocytogenes]|nr:tape measure protein [Listeria monocytogenes]